MPINMEKGKGSQIYFLICAHVALVSGNMPNDEYPVGLTDFSSVSNTLMSGPTPRVQVIPFGQQLNRIRVLETCRANLLVKGVVWIQRLNFSPCL
ncbi:hypothetical protein DAI22_08g190500 [Oryza sativa Japonica Group]|nr:hypothetical protein DAI22_08g190500 [Oryza sativa Japonica Group]